MRTPEQLARHRESQRRYRERHPDRIRAMADAYIQTDAFRLMHNKSIRTYRARHPEKRNAHQNVQRAVKAGRLLPLACFCGVTKTEAHHYLGYAPEHYLDVRWLCRTHHREAHA